MTPKTLATLTIAAAVFGGCAFARAGGTPDEEADQQMPSKAIVGFVKDANGSIVADAKVVVTKRRSAAASTTAPIEIDCVLAQQ